MLAKIITNKKLLINFMNRFPQSQSSKQNKFPRLYSQQQLAMNALRQISNDQSFSQQVWTGQNISTAKDKSKSNRNLKSIKTMEAQIYYNQKSMITPFSYQRQIKNKNVKCNYMSKSSKKLMQKMLPTIAPKNLIFKSEQMNFKLKKSHGETRKCSLIELRKNMLQESKKRQEQEDFVNNLKKKLEQRSQTFKSVQNSQHYGCLIPRQYFTGNSDEYKQKDWQSIKKLIRHRRISSKSFKIIIRKNRQLSESSLNLVKQPLKVKSYKRDIQTKQKNQSKQNRNVATKKTEMQRQQNSVQQQKSRQSQRYVQKDRLQQIKVTNIQILSLKQGVRLSFKKRKVFQTLDSNL